MPIAENGVREHFWLINITSKGSKLYGVIDNEPRPVSNVKRGQKIVIERGKISDWMYVLGNPENPYAKPKLIGGYTVRVQFLRAPKAVRDQLPFVIE